MKYEWWNMFHVFWCDIGEGAMCEFGDLPWDCIMRLGFPNHQNEKFFVSNDAQKSDTSCILVPCVAALNINRGWLWFQSSVFITSFLESASGRIGGFGWWFEFLASPYERDCYLLWVPLESETTGTQTISWLEVAWGLIHLIQSCPEFHKLGGFIKRVELTQQGDWGRHRNLSAEMSDDICFFFRLVCFCF